MNHRWRRLSLCLLVAVPVVLAGCGAGDYVRASASAPYGYLDQQLDQADYTVVARGPVRMPHQRVVEIAYLRAARLALAAGARYFMIMHEQTGRVAAGQPTPVAMPIAPQIAAGGTGEPFAMLLIRLLPPDTPPIGAAYDAQALSHHLGKKLDVK